jgi:hypothetical protein
MFSINDQEFFSGTAVIGPNQNLKVKFPWGETSFSFHPDVSPMSINIVNNGAEIVCNGTDNPLGVASAMELPLADGRKILLNIVVHSIGDEKNIIRLVHYSYGFE